MTTLRFAPTPPPVRDVEADLLLDALRTNAVFLSVGVALAGVIVAATVFVLNTRISRRAATVEAWRAWATDTSAARIRLSQNFPALRMSREDALRIRVLTPPAPWWNRSLAAERTRMQESRRDINVILNGLARIAMGTQAKILDRKLLSSIASRRIAAAYIRFEEYILVVREGQPTRPAQPGAFAELTRLATEMAGGEEGLDKLRRSRSTS